MAEVSAGGVTFSALRPEDRPEAPAYGLRILDGRGGLVFISPAEARTLGRFISHQFPESE